ncbi:hypothetical protein [Blastococcus sp. VKM Ac-2987]|uniref:hypothetical protein n=1 Tax=Blastococcus sp. VKM Ac-2987 TaxID=3004141 RepID=UPI0022ABB386|nr:hypothetical protein [Blastococcus sp. VKM Ac-2987]MCZ2857436.1 hypothetical protein [Blastococcus sp. VKM Ac-2987]
MNLEAIRRALEAAHARDTDEPLITELIHQGWIPPAEVSDHPPRMRAGREEGRLARALQQQELSATQQYPIYSGQLTYFVDIVCGRVAIEVESAGVLSQRYDRLERANDIIEAGWFLVYVDVGKVTYFADTFPKTLAEHIAKVEADEAPAYAGFRHTGLLVETGTYAGGRLHIVPAPPPAPVLPQEAKEPKPFRRHQIGIPNRIPPYIPGLAHPPDERRLPDEAPAQDEGTSRTKEERE